MSDVESVTVVASGASTPIPRYGTPDTLRPLEENVEFLSRIQEIEERLCRLELSEERSSSDDPEDAAKLASPAVAIAERTVFDVPVRDVERLIILFVCILVWFCFGKKFIYGT